MKSLKELKLELKKLNGLQWTKSRLLDKIIERRSKLDHDMALTVELEDGIEYVSKTFVLSYLYLNQKISKLTRDLNKRRKDIRILQSQIEQLKMSRSKDAYFTHVTDNLIVGIHSTGYEGPNKEYIQEEIWANYYKEDSNGILQMTSGSYRVHDEFDDIVNEYKQDPNYLERI